MNWAACALVGRMVTDLPLMVTTGMPEASITTPRMMRGELATSTVCPSPAEGSVKTIVGSGGCGLRHGYENAGCLRPRRAGGGQGVIRGVLRYQRNSPRRCHSADAGFKVEAGGVAGSPDQRHGAAFFYRGGFGVQADVQGGRGWRLHLRQDAVEILHGALDGHRPCRVPLRNLLECARLFHTVPQ